MNSYEFGMIFDAIRIIALFAFVIWFLVKVFYLDRKKAKNKVEYDKYLRKSVLKGVIGTLIVVSYVALNIFILFLPTIIAYQNDGDTLAALVYAFIYILPAEVFVAMIIGVLAIGLAQKYSDKKAEAKKNKK